MTLREKADKFTEFLNEKGIIRTCIGLAEKSVYSDEEKLYVYLEKKKHKTKDIPTEFMGVPVETQVIGKIRPL